MSPRTRRAPRSASQDARRTPAIGGGGFSAATAAALKELEDDLQRLADRLNHGLSVHAELVRTAHGKPFVIRHPGMWRMLLGERDMVVIDLASWVKAFYSPGGFLRRLQGDDLRALARRCRYDEQRFEVENSDDATDEAEDGDDGLSAVEFIRAEWERTKATWRDAAFERLFPGTPSGVPNLQSIAALVETLRTRFEPLLDDRDVHRAHRYERETSGSATMLAPPLVAEHLAACQELLADLRALSSNSTFLGVNYKPEADPDDEEARDVVDLILRGSLANIAEEEFALANRMETRTNYVQRRAAYYDALHADHDARGASATDPFNQFWRISLGELKPRRE